MIVKRGQRSIARSKNEPLPNPPGTPKITYGEEKRSENWWTTPPTERDDNLTGFEAREWNVL
jgi:hypothetical protein